MNEARHDTVLLTGGTGFLGAYILRELIDKGYRVRALRRGSTLPFFIDPAILGKVEWVPGDILDVAGLEDALEGVDCVIHSAAKISFSKKDRRELFRTNIEGTANMVNMTLGKNVRRFLYVSSVSALGRTRNEEKVTEERHWEEGRLNTNYAISKFRGEMEVWRGIAEGLQAVIVNPTTILGFGDWHNTSCAIFRNIFNEFPWYTEGVNGFVDVGDTARAIVRLLDSDLSGQRYIINGDNWSYRKLFTEIATEFGKRPPAREATPFLAGIAWRVERMKSLFSGRASLLTRESARVAQSKTSFDNTKVLQALPGFSFTPLETSIRETCRLYLQQAANHHTKRYP
jgi:nucleoside-diphosphate-sugar epimerase